MSSLDSPTALTIAGFDPSSGAGVTADLQVFAAHGVFGTAAITALTVQSTMGVRRVEPMSPTIVRQTLETLHQDLPPRGVKIGMLAGEQQVLEVARYLRRLSGSGTVVVLDPVLRSSSGTALLSEPGLVALREELLPLVDVITPNVSELSLLADQACIAEDDIRCATEFLAERGSRAIVVTGGDREKPDDLVYDAGSWTVLEGVRIESRATHGTGCAFSSALLCGMVRGSPLAHAAHAAKLYVAEAMRTATPRGSGRGPMNLLWPILGHRAV